MQTAMRTVAEPFVYISLETFERLAAENDLMRLERGPDGRLIALPPTGTMSGFRGSELVKQLGNWNDRDHRGRVGEAQTGYLLPNTAVRAPDASWVSNARLAAAGDLGESFGKVVPEFAVEVVSSSDSLGEVRAKAQEYLSVGVLLVWVIDPFKRTVEIYRPGANVEILHDPHDVSAEPELPGFVLNVQPVFEPC